MLQVDEDDETSRIYSRRMGNDEKVLHRENSGYASEPRGGVDWQYNWGLRKNVSKIKNPQDGKHLAELDWVRIVVNPVDGVVVLMDSKQSQDVLRQSVQLEKEFVCLVVIYAWKFMHEEESRPTPNWTRAVASVIGRHEDEAELISGPEPTDDTLPDFTWYERGEFRERYHLHYLR